MMCLNQFTNKNNGLCVRCLASCVPFISNGTHLQPPNHNALTINVYLVYCFYRARMCAELAQLSFLINSQSLFNFSSTLNKKLLCEKNILNDTHHKHLNKSLTSKGFGVFTIFKNANHDSKHHKHLVEIA